MQNRQNLTPPPYAPNPKQELKTREAQPCGKVRWSPDGEQLALITPDACLEMRSAKTGECRHKVKLRYHANDLAWGPDARVIAVASDDHTIQTIRADNGTAIRSLQAHTQPVTAVAWRHDSNILASGSADGTIRLWETDSWASTNSYKNPNPRSTVTALSWVPGQSKLIAAYSDGSLLMWDLDNRPWFTVLRGHASCALSLDCSNDATLLASSSTDRTIRIWDVRSGQPLVVLEGHTDSVTSISFSSDGRLLASHALDSTIRFWATDSWTTLRTHRVAKSSTNPQVEFHPKQERLATNNSQDMSSVDIRLNFASIFQSPTRLRPIYYTNAKVVLIGDTGVGKSGLALVLTNQSFQPTDSTHARRILTMDTSKSELPNGRVETRELLLWDLAGQPGYRLVHQLNLQEVAVAILVFDARSEGDPLSSVNHWNKALKQAQAANTGWGIPLKKILVAARTDRGGVGIPRKRLDAIKVSLGLSDYFETSAREGWNIQELALAIRGSIDWSLMPKVSSTELFQNIREFLLHEKDSGRLLSPQDDLFQSFISSAQVASTGADLRDQFDTCIHLAESRGLVRKLSFGKLVLLQPELMDAYAASILNAARQEQDGLGSILEDIVLSASFPMSRSERIQPLETEHLILISAVEDLLRHEIALREHSNEGSYLVFPAQLTRDWPEAPDPAGKSCVFKFEGALQSIYATLAVRLAHSGMFSTPELWKNAAVYKSQSGTCGIYMRETEEGQGEITIFFGRTVNKDTKSYFIRFIESHLERRAVRDSISRTNIIACTRCESEMDRRHVELRRTRGQDFINCPVCDLRISIPVAERIVAEWKQKDLLPQLDRSADARRDMEAATSVLRGKEVVQDFDVFLCHNSRNKKEVRSIGESLKERGVLPWLDEWELRPGIPWQKALEEQIGRIRSAAVFVGRDGIGPWQEVELDAFLREFVRRGCPVIPVILSSCKKEPKLPLFLAGNTWVDFRLTQPDPTERLIWGITGDKYQPD